MTKLWRRHRKRCSKSFEELCFDLLCVRHVVERHDVCCIAMTFSTQYGNVDLTCWDVWVAFSPFAQWTRTSSILRSICGETMCWQDSRRKTMGWCRIYRKLFTWKYNYIDSRRSFLCSRHGKSCTHERIQSTASTVTAHAISKSVSSRPNRHIAFRYRRWCRDDSILRSNIFDAIHRTIPVTTNLFFAADASRPRWYYSMFFSCQFSSLNRTNNKTQIPTMWQLLLYWRILPRSTKVVWSAVYCIHAVKWLSLMTLEQQGLPDDIWRIMWAGMPCFPLDTEDSYLVFW